MPTCCKSLADPSYPGQVERAIVFEVEAWDRNCPQHIHQRLPVSLVTPMVDRLQSRIQELEQQIESMRPGVEAIPASQDGVGTRSA